MYVSWSPIYYPPVERYIVHYNDKSENKPTNHWPLFSPTHPAATSAIIDELNPSAMYNVRVNAEFSSTNIYDPSYAPSSTRRQGDLSEIHVADIYRRKRNVTNLSSERERTKDFSSLGKKYIPQYDEQLSRPYNMSAIDITSNSVKLLFFFNETNLDSRRQIQKLEVNRRDFLFKNDFIRILGSL